MFLLFFTELTFASSCDVEKLIRNHICSIKRQIDNKKELKSIKMPVIKPEWTGVNGVRELQMLIKSVNKRLRNRKSAKLSREKKRARLEFLENDNKRLSKENEELKLENQRLKRLRKVSHPMESQFKNEPEDQLFNNIDFSSQINSPETPLSLGCLNSPDSNPVSPKITVSEDEGFDYFNLLDSLEEFTPTLLDSLEEFTPTPEEASFSSYYYSNSSESNPVSPRTSALNAYISEYIIKPQI